MARRVCSARRRKRLALPPEILADPLSIPNVRQKLRAIDLEARISLAGDPPFERAELAVDFPASGRSRFILDARRNEQGRMVWTMSWDGNRSRAGQRRYRQAIRTDLYRLMMLVIQNADALVPDHFAPK